VEFVEIGSTFLNAMAREISGVGSAGA
jgi:hypothetical protein